jgi:protocatechuate 3,4-dioxygenase beta subunit
MGTMLIAVALLLQSADSVTVPGVVVDPAGQPVPDVEVVLAARKLPEGSVPTLARATTDARGGFRLEVARQRLQGVGPIRVIWAYRPGRTIVLQRAELAGSGVLPPVRLTLAEPFRRTATIRDPDGRPLAGVRLAPLLCSMNGRALYLTPDDWLERLTVATGPDGVATLPDLPANVDPRRLRVTAPGIAPHDFPLPDRPGSDRLTLEIGRPARLAGAVSDESGRPAANVPVEVWADELFYEPSNPNGRQRAMGRGRLVHFDRGPIRTEADGSFLTPSQLMTGRSYRIIVRPEGDPPVESRSLTASAERTDAPPLGLRHQQRRALVGLVRDRQGRPVAGARVFLPSGEPSTTTDARGRYRLEGILPDRTYLLVQAEGFRLQGWPGIPAGQPEEQTLALVRTSEPRDRTMAALPAPISRDEARALARRVLEPYLRVALEKGDDRSRWDAIRMLSQVDPTRALELLEKQHVQSPGFDDAGLRYRIAAELLATDPVEAESIVAAIASPGGYVWLAEALPDTERDRKRGLLERATVQVQAPTGAGHGADPRNRLFVLARVAGGWLDLGEVEKARPLIRVGLDTVAALPPPGRYLPGFLPTAARLETDRVLSLIRELSNARRRTCYVAIAEALASDHPAEAERVFQLIDDSSNVPVYELKNEVTLRLCLPIAKTDPERARRLVAGLKTPREQACGWALVALSLADRDRPAAGSALDESIRLIDRLGGPRDPAERVNRRVRVAENPAASILPIVERVAPERLEEVFWKAVALMPKGDADVVTFLARYDRQVAEVLLSPTEAVRSRNPSGYVYAFTRPKAAVDPRGAVAMFEALPPVSPDSGVMIRLIDQARAELINCLVEPIDESWKEVWRHSGIPIDKPRFPEAGLLGIGARRRGIAHLPCGLRGLGRKRESP